MNKKEESQSSVFENIQKLHTIRTQGQALLKLAQQDRLNYFAVNPAKMLTTAQYVADVIYDQYPGLDIPYHSRWRHFEAGGIDRISKMPIYDLPEQEQGKILYELVIISVLLDAGAGKHWHYKEAGTEQSFSRSEGLALASLSLYQSGIFSKDPEQPLRVDGEKLRTFTAADLKKYFQVTEMNPLEGVDGRVALLNRLGAILNTSNQYFGDDGRLGNFYTYLLTLQNNKKIAASAIFQAVLAAFKEVWPKRIQVNGISLGDVWIHSALKTDKAGSDLVPFHKLSQWLTYSLIEPLEMAGVEVTLLDELTGLPEYRNGGLLIDTGLLQVKDQRILQQPQAPDSEAIVEWRALTVALLDELANHIRIQLNKSATELPLAKILQGGTWEAGRRIAKEKRKEGIPPIQIISDGTIF